MEFVCTGIEACTVLQCIWQCYTTHSLWANSWRDTLICRWHKLRCIHAAETAAFEHLKSFTNCTKCADGFKLHSLQCLQDVCCSPDQLFQTWPYYCIFWCRLADFDSIRRVLQSKLSWYTMNILLVSIRLDRKIALFVKAWVPKGHFGSYVICIDLITSDPWTWSWTHAQYPFSDIEYFTLRLFFCTRKLLYWLHLTTVWM